MIDLPIFPDPRDAPEHGLVAIGGDFLPRTLLTAYAQGIFPWPSEGLPRAWFSPDPRMVLVPGELHVSRSLRKVLRRRSFRITFDLAFERVVRACAAAPRPGQPGTWITEEMIAGYTGLHRLGLAHSVETWLDEGEECELVGGLYGISLGGYFSGESMFFHRPDASKAAFVHLVRRLEAWDFDFVDCQVYTDHVARFGATEWPREEFLATLAASLRRPTRSGPWTLPQSSGE